MMTVGELKKLLETYPDDMLCVDSSSSSGCMFSIEVEEYDLESDDHVFNVDVQPKTVLIFS